VNKVGFKRKRFSVNLFFTRRMKMILTQCEFFTIQNKVIFLINGYPNGVTIMNNLLNGCVISQIKWL